MRSWKVVAAVAIGCGAGCGGNGPTSVAGPSAPTGPIMDTSGPYQPLVVQATWTYAITDSGAAGQKVNTIEALEDVGGSMAGVMAYREHSTLSGGAQDTWYQRDGDIVKRLHELSYDATGAKTSDVWYDPYRLRVDESAEHTVVGASWMWSYSETKTTRSHAAVTRAVTESWRVDAVDQPIGVAAGNFKSLQLTHVDPTDGSTKTYWFVRGVGKIREQSSGGHLEELTSYQIPQQ